MYQLLATALTWLFFWGATAMVIISDDRRSKALAKQRGQVDFVDRRVRTYVGAAFFLGAFVLVLYFWSTRKSAAWGLVGVAALVGNVLLTLVVSAVLSGAASWLDHAALQRTCAAVVSGTDGDECANYASRYPDSAALLETGCRRGGVSPCLDRDPDSDLFGAPDTGEPRKRSEWYERARALCAARPKTEPRGRCEVLDVVVAHP